MARWFKYSWHHSALLMDSFSYLDSTVVSNSVLFYKALATPVVFLPATPFLTLHPRPFYTVLV